MWTICWLLTNHSNHSQWIVGIMAEDCFEYHLTNVLPFAFVASQRISNQAVKVLIRYINKLFENVHKTGRERVDVCLFLQDDEKAFGLLWWWWWEEHKSWCVFIVFRSPHPDVCYTPISSEAGKEYLNIFHDLQNKKRKVTFLFQWNQQKSSKWELIEKNENAVMSLNWKGWSLVEMEEALKRFIRKIHRSLHQKTISTKKMKLRKCRGDQF